MLLLNGHTYRIKIKCYYVFRANVHKWRIKGNHMWAGIIMRRRVLLFLLVHLLHLHTSSGIRRQIGKRNMFTVYASQTQHVYCLCFSSFFCLFLSYCLLHRFHVDAKLNIILGKVSLALLIIQLISGHQSYF